LGTGTTLEKLSQFLLEQVDPVDLARLTPRNQRVVALVATVQFSKVPQQFLRG
jgi:hypothetical protein